MTHSGCLQRWTKVGRLTCSCIFFADCERGAFHSSGADSHSCCAFLCIFHDRMVDELGLMPIRETDDPRAAAKKGLKMAAMKVEELDKGELDAVLSFSFAFAAARGPA